MSELIKAKTKDTCLNRYNKEWYQQTDRWKNQVRKKWNIKLIENIIPSIVGLVENETTHTIIEMNPKNVQDYITLKCKHGHIFKKRLYSLRYNTVCPQCRVKSKAEIEIIEFLKSNIKDFIFNGDRSIITPLELDIFVPGRNLAIEYNGIYWHSEWSGDKNKNYHLNKTELCEKQGIQLLHIFENEWISKQDIVKSIILSKLGIYKERIYARKCVVRKIDNTIKKNFLEEKHIQGNDKSSVRLGLFYDDRLVSVMTFGKRKITGGKSKFELIRFCSELNTQVVGGASKLFKHFIKNGDFKSITTYADRRYSDGKFYEKLGFKLSHVSKPNYWYLYGNNTCELQHRVAFQKHKLKDKLDVFDPELTEWENMTVNGYDRIWDCGNYVYEFSK